MKRSVAVTLMLTLLLLGGAALLYQSMFESPGGNKNTPGPGVAIAGNGSGTNGTNTDVDPAHVVDAGLRVSADGGLANLSDGGPVSGTPGDDKFRAKVASVRGKVETRRSGGEWKDLAAGQPLRKDDSVRTGRTGEANLDVGDGVKVRLSPRSEFSIQELDDNLSRIRLAEGHVTASVDPDGNQVLKVEAEGSDAVAQSAGGTFGVISDGKGQVAVATTTGKVRFTSKGKSVDVPAGKETSVTKTTGPSKPRPIPRSLLLKVAPNRVKTRRRSTYVEGNTAPGNLVRVQGETAKVDARGRFRVKVALRDGPNRVAVEVTDATGRTRRKKLPPVIVDRIKPNINANMEWGEGQSGGNSGGGGSGSGG